MSGHLIVMWADRIEVDASRLRVSHVPALARLLATALRQFELRSDDPNGRNQ